MMTLSGGRRNIVETFSQSVVKKMLTSIIKNKNKPLELISVNQRAILSQKIISYNNFFVTFYYDFKLTYNQT